MYVGVEIIPGTIDDAIPKLHALADTIDIVKLRDPNHLLEILGNGLRFDWVTRPPSEGRNPDETVADYYRWYQVMRQTDQVHRWIAHLLWNESNHPDGQYAGPGRAIAFMEDIGRPTLARIPAQDRLTALYASGTVPYNNTVEWAAELDYFPELGRGGHCYQNRGDVALAVADCLAQAGESERRLFIADEVGDTWMGASPAVRAAHIMQEFRELARAGISMAILFPFSGSADASISYDTHTIRTILNAGRFIDVRPTQPLRRRIMNRDDLIALAFDAGRTLKRYAKIPKTFAPGAALSDHWVANKGRLGAAITPELVLDEGEVGQVFASSIACVWTGSEVVEL